LSNKKSICEAFYLAKKSIKENEITDICTEYNKFLLLNKDPNEHRVAHHRDITKNHCITKTSKTMRLPKEATLSFLSNIGYHGLIVFGEILCKKS
jgi:hypothetical protein